MFTFPLSATNGKIVFKCTICDKIFSNSYNLNRHSKSHSGFQPFVCFYQECKKRFSYSYHLYG